MSIRFKPYDVFKTDILIETGTLCGAFIASMLSHYKQLHTIEIIPDLYEEAVGRFSMDDHVVCHLGDSAKKLKKVLHTISEPVTFWLDAHYQGYDQTQDTKRPLLGELEVIANHPIKTHMIMCDDVRLFDQYGTTKEEVEKIILDINPDYIITYMPGFIEDDVLVAVVI